MSKAQQVLDLIEAVEPEERAKYVAYAKALKAKLTKDFGVPLKSRVLKSQRPNPFIEIRVADYEKDVIPNDFRVKVAKALGHQAVRDWDNVVYGNIMKNSVTLYYSEWVKVLGEL